MPQLQHILVLWAQSPDLAAPICAWSSYDPSPDWVSPAGSEDAPPFPSVLAALRAGWRIIQYPVAIPAYPGFEDDTSHLKHEFVLERIQEHAHV